ncbi:unnamed protein product [Streptomyces laurentii]|uniref:Uncharacterized protein n=1 Tax=Streptomyces laurentii TaxID=39478 RepID=A0A170RZB6_STRLU|nr:unnamed protein product [Streptomyces laurentii]
MRQFLLAEPGPPAQAAQEWPELSAGGLGGAHRVIPRYGIAAGTRVGRRARQRYFRRWNFLVTALRPVVDWP